MNNVEACKCPHCEGYSCRTVDAMFEVVEQRIRSRRQRGPVTAATVRAAVNEAGIRCQRGKPQHINGGWYR